MQKLSRDRIATLARTLVDAMSRHDSVRLLKDREAVRQSIIHALMEELKHDEERAAHALRRLSLVKPSPMTGSPEWVALFDRFMEEEYEKQGFDRV
jgi:hypothetical protein